MRCKRLIRTGLIAAILFGATPRTMEAAEAAEGAEAAETPGTYVSRTSCLGILNDDAIRSRPIRVTRRDGTIVAGRIRSLEERSVTLMSGDPLSSPRAIDEEEIASITYSIPTGPRKSYVALGAAIGACLGFLLGYYATDPGEPDPDEFLVMSEEDQRSLSGAAGMLLGAGIGALFGLAASSEPVEDREFSCAH